MMEVEKKAASLPPKLTAPMILFFLTAPFADPDPGDHPDFGTNLLKVRATERVVTC